MCRWCSAVCSVAKVLHFGTITTIPMPLSRYASFLVIFLISSFVCETPERLFPSHSKDLIPPIGTTVSSVEYAPPPMTNGMQWRKRKQTHDSSSLGGGAFSLVALPRLARGKGLEGEKGERLSLRETCHFFFTVTPKLRALSALSLSVPSALLCRFVAYGSVQVFCSVSALSQHGEETKRSVVARRCLVPSHPL